MEVNFTNGTSHIFDGAEITDELGAFATTKPLKKWSDRRRDSLKN